MKHSNEIMILVMQYGRMIVYLCILTLIGGDLFFQMNMGRLDFNGCLFLMSLIMAAFCGTQLEKILSSISKLCANEQEQNADPAKEEK